MPKMSHDEFLVLATRRSEARLAKNFAEADRLRKQIEDGGYIITDDKDGSGAYSFTVKPDIVAPVEAVVSVLSPVKKPRKR